jgi:hypothetical protein
MKYNESFFDLTNSIDRQTFISDKEKIIDYFHLYWLSFLIFKKHFPNSPKLSKFMKTMSKTQIKNIDDGNDLASITKYANDLGLLSGTSVNALTKFLFLMKTSKDLQIDESLVRKWFVSSSNIHLPENTFLKQARKDFVAGATLLDIYPLVLKYFKAKKSELQITQIYHFLTYSAFTVNILQAKGVIANTPSPAVVSQVATDARTDSVVPVQTTTQSVVSNKIDISKIEAYIDEIKIKGMKEDKELLDDRNYVISTVLYSGSEGWLGRLDPNLSLENINALKPYIFDEYLELIKLPLKSLESRINLQAFLNFMFAFLIKSKELATIDKKISLFKPIIKNEKFYLKLDVEDFNYLFTTQSTCGDLIFNFLVKEKEVLIALLEAGSSLTDNTTLIVKNYGSETPDDFIEKLDARFKMFSTSKSSILINKLIDKYDSIEIVALLQTVIKKKQRYSPRYSKSTRRLNLDLIFYILFQYYENKKISFGDVVRLIVTEGAYKDRVTAYIRWKYKELFDISKLSDEEIIQSYLDLGDKDLNEVHKELVSIKREHLFLPYILQDSYAYRILSYPFEESSRYNFGIDAFKANKNYKELIRTYVTNAKNLKDLEYMLKQSEDKDFFSFLLDCFPDENSKIKFFTSLVEINLSLTSMYLYKIYFNLPTKQIFDIWVDINNGRIGSKRLTTSYISSVRNKEDDLYKKEFYTLLFDYMCLNNFTSFDSDYAVQGNIKNYVMENNESLKKLRLEWLQKYKDSTNPDIRNSTKITWIFNEKYLEVNKDTLWDSFGIGVFSYFKASFTLTIFLKYLLDEKKYSDVIDNIDFFFRNFATIKIFQLLFFEYPDFFNSYFDIILDSIEKNSKREITNILDDTLEEIIKSDKKELIPTLLKILNKDVWLKSLIAEITDAKLYLESISLSFLALLEKYQIKEIDSLLLRIQEEDEKVFKKMVYIMKRSFLSESVYSDLLFSENNPLPLEDIAFTRQNIKNFLKVNDENLQLRLPSKQLKKGESFLVYINNLKEISKDVVKTIQASLPDPKVVEVPKTEQELKDTSFEINLKYNTQKHGNVGLKIIKEWDYVTSQEQLDAIQEFLGARPESEVAVPAFHSCGTLAANMILRYWFSLSSKVEKVAKGLGAGIYFAPVIEKSLQYLGDTGMSRSHGTRGYVLDCTLYLGNHAGRGDDGDYRDAAGTGWVSAEYVIRDPWKQCKINKVYYAEIAPIREFKNELKARGYDEDHITGVDRFLTSKEKGTKYDK